MDSPVPVPLTKTDVQITAAILNSTSDLLEVVSAFLVLLLGLLESGLVLSEARRSQGKVQGDGSRNTLLAMCAGLDCMTKFLNYVHTKAANFRNGMVAA